MSLLLRNRGRVLLASEGTSGSDAIDAPILNDGTADIIYMPVYDDFEIQPERGEVEFPRLRASHSGVRHVSFPDLCNVTFTTPLFGRAGSGAGEESPYISPVLGAMNLNSIVVASTSDTRNPSTVQKNAMTAYWYVRNAEDNLWRLLTATGIRGTGVFNFAVREEPTIAFTGIGRYVEEFSDAAAFFSSANGEIALRKDGSTAVAARTTGSEFYVAEDPPVCKSMSITINGNVWRLSNFSMDLGWTATTIADMTGSGAVNKVILTRASEGARIGGSFSFHGDSDTALDDLFDLLEGDTEFAWSLQVATGTTSGSDRITLSGSKMQLVSRANGDDGGVWQHDAAFALNGDWSDVLQEDDFSIVFDAVP